MPRLHLKLSVPEKDGKLKDKTYNLYSPAATVEETMRNNNKIRYIACDNHCEAWTTAVVKFINSVPR